MKFCDRPGKALAGQFGQRFETEVSSTNSRDSMQVMLASVRSAFSCDSFEITVTAVTTVTCRRNPIAEYDQVSESEARIVMTALHFRASPGDDGDGGDDNFIIQ